MMTSVVEEIKAFSNPSNEAHSEKPIPANTLIMGKKNATEYLTPAVFRISTTGELVIRARGSLSIVTAVDVAEIVKRNINDLESKSIVLGTEEVVSGGISKRMSFIEIYLAKRIQEVNETFTSAANPSKKPKVTRKSSAKKSVRKNKSKV